MTIDVLNNATNASNASPKCNNNILNSTAMPTVVRPVRRSLFGPVDNEQSIEFLHQELNNISSIQQMKWNFDFVSGRPLNDDGRNKFEWQPVRSDDGVPVAYALNGSTSLRSNNVSSGPATVSQPAVSPSNNDNDSSLKLKFTSKVTRLRQTSIMDYAKIHKTKKNRKKSSR